MGDGVGRLIVLEGKGRNGRGGWEAASSMKLPFKLAACGNPTRKRHIPRKESIITVNNSPVGMLDRSSEVPCIGIH
jgi:hypothetical protein